MEVAKNTVSRVQIRKHRISEKTFNRIILVLSFFLITGSIYTITVAYQSSRYRDGIPCAPGTFICVDYTKEMIGWLDKVGIKSYQVIGTAKGKSVGHSWVGIDCFGTILNFEPQTLTFFDPTQDYEDIFVNKH